MGCSFTCGGVKSCVVSLDLPRYGTHDEHTMDLVTTLWGGDLTFQQPLASTPHMVDACNGRVSNQPPTHFV